MTTEIAMIAPCQSIRAAADRMRERRVGALLVMNEDRLVGIISERDLLRAMADGMDPRFTPTSVCMTPHPSTIEPEAEAAEAAARMVERRVRHLPVVRRGSLLGVISARDLLPLTEGVAAGARGSEPW